MKELKKKHIKGWANSPFYYINNSGKSTITGTYFNPGFGNSFTKQPRIQNIST